MATKSYGKGDINVRRTAWRSVVLFCFLFCLTVQAQEKGSAPQQDGPINITFGHLYKDGKVGFSDVDTAKIAPMPRGYVSYRNKGFKVETDAIVSGPNVIDFVVPSISDRVVFGNLRVLCTAWDKVDEKPFWIDCTIDAPDSHARDFDARRVSARTEHSGTFALALRLPADAPAPLAKADLSVEIIAPAGRALANSELRFEVRVTNRGPGNASDIEIRGAGFSSDEFVSAAGPAEGNGRCRQDGSNYGCKLDRLAKGETAIFHLVLRPTESLHGQLASNQPLFLNAVVYCPQQDHYPDNNHSEVSVKVWSDPNAAPTLKLLSPAQGTVFISPANIKLSAEASDPDGRVAKVEFYDGRKLIGAGRAESKSMYTLDWNDAPPGQHVLTVIVTDDGGRTVYETTSFFVNGALSVSIRSPLPDTVIKLKAISRGENEIAFEPLSLEAEASIGSRGRKIKEVAFVLNYTAIYSLGRQIREVAKPVGVDAATSETLYAATFKELGHGSYSLTAVATDEDGIESISRVTFRVKVSPLISLKPERNPVTLFKVPARIPLVATLYGTPLSIEARRKVRVDFYADGKLIGSAEADRFMSVVRFVWEGAQPGMYSITAIATDSENAASAPSEPLQITVRNQ
jgi:hypothetical protein